MSSVGSSGAGRERRRRTTAIKDGLRELTNQISLLNHQVSAQVDLRNVDLDCLDLIGREGPMSPSALARRTGLHPATMTGILDRLQSAGWVMRERDPDATDRRAVTVRALRERGGEMYRLYSGMNAALDGIIAGYSDEELSTLEHFIRATIEAGRAATEALAEG